MKYENESSRKKARAETYKKYHDTVKDSLRINERRYNLKKYGMTIEDYEKLSEEQNHVCAICGNAETDTYRGIPKRLAVDHCHQSNKVRGLLCSSCNRALGLFKDNSNTLLNAIDYLEESK